MRFVWFWTFWHWSTEAYRCRALLRDPLHGIAGHWDEWYNHEAPEDVVREIEWTGRTEATQRKFIAWLYRHWARRSDWPDNRLIPRFVLGQLSHVQPFRQWKAFEKYRADYGLGGVSAVVLAAESGGEPADVRPVEAMLLPPDAGTADPGIVTEGFQTERADLQAARRAAGDLLRGKGLALFLASWIAVGRRPYPGWLRFALGAGWVAVGGLVLRLVVGPDPGERLYLLVFVLAVLWFGLVAAGMIVAGNLVFKTWMHGRRLGAHLERNQVWMRMPGGLTLKGGSAGLAFALNMLLASHRADPLGAGGSWVWRRAFHGLRRARGSWAATGVVAPDGTLKPVALDSKLRACLLHSRIQNILTPRQRVVRDAAIGRIAESIHRDVRRGEPARVTGVAARLGFASEVNQLSSHACRNLAGVVMVVGDLFSRRQLAVGALALVTSVVMLAAAPDIRAILRPHPAPRVIGPASPSPYHLWVNLETRHPDYFRVVLESDYWSNRLAEVKAHGGENASVRAEILLRRLTRQSTFDEEDGTVWIERRRRFLGRELATGERVGHYTLSYLSRLGHE